MASPASPPRYMELAIETMHVNTTATELLLQHATKHGSRLLFASTSEIYGDPKVSPQKEDYWGNVNPIGVRSCYDEGKRAAETLFVDYHRQYGTDIRIARIFNTYGPRMAIHDGRVVSNFVVQALKGENLTVYGDGSQIRSLCYVSDLINGLVSLFFKPDVHEPINLGNPEPLTMLELAEEIKSITNSKSVIKFEPLPSDDPMTREPDISRASELLDLHPKINRRAGLTETIKYFESVI